MRLGAAPRPCYNAGDMDPISFAPLPATGAPEAPSSSCDGWDAPPEPLLGGPLDLGQKLLCAAAFGRLGELRALLGAGADARVSDRMGMTPLMLAAAKGWIGCVNALLPHSDPAASDLDGRRALAYACMGGHAHCAAALAPSSDAKAACLHGSTALMEASRTGSLECVRTLLSLAPLRADPAGARSALDLALELGHASCASLLLPLADLSKGKRRDGALGVARSCAPGLAELVEQEMARRAALAESRALRRSLRRPSSRGAQKARL